MRRLLPPRAEPILASSRSDRRFARFRLKDPGSMPVFSRLKNDILVLTADGDYTPGELARVGANAFGRQDGDGPGPVLLDLSGAAGLDRKSAESLTAEGAALAAHRDRISRLAVVVPSRFSPLFDGDGPFAGAVGVEVKPCTSHADARAWLAS